MSNTCNTTCHKWIQYIKIGTAVVVIYGSWIHNYLCFSVYHH